VHSGAEHPSRTSLAIGGILAFPSLPWMMAIGSSTFFG